MQQGVVQEILLAQAGTRRRNAHLQLGTLLPQVQMHRTLAQLTRQQLQASVASLLQFQREHDDLARKLVMIQQRIQQGAQNAQRRSVQTSQANSRVQLIASAMTNATTRRTRASMEMQDIQIRLAKIREAMRKQVQQAQANRELLIKEVLKRVRPSERKRVEKLLRAHPETDPASIVMLFRAKKKFSF